MLSHKFSENVLDATKKFEKLITNKKEIDGLPTTALGLAAQRIVSNEVYCAYITRASSGNLDNIPIINRYTTDYARGRKICDGDLLMNPILESMKNPTSRWFQGDYFLGFYDGKIPQLL
ncbi:hypothetical protein Goshw_027998 [Gossypium schwendimanii]|uniref:Uncharacterized protein n=1 Tax=Gossypium schwendimanii TaxID=34291 RepID=A0A7J9MXP9_GOSSC|nr:hypothetical protein [Gossypium schwendimanii]